MKKITWNISLTINKNEFSFTISNPISVSRTISLSHQSNAFNLPQFTSSAFSYEDVFTGDVLQGGSCNVDVLSFCPHNLTHIECSSHILNQRVSQAVTIDKIPQDHFQGLVYLIDLSTILKEEKLILMEHLKDELAKVNYPINAIALKTSSSLLQNDYDFSGKNFVALSREVAKEISKYSFEGQNITTLILDLPSTDSENDGGKLLAHRAFFEIPETGIEFKDIKKKVIVELAHFGQLVQNYYYFIMTPAKIQSNSIITDILFYPLIQNQK